MNERKTLTKNESGILTIGGITATNLVKEYSTPLYVMDEKYIEDMCDIYKKTLNEIYGEGEILYASKAFSCKAIYQTIHNVGIGADVVSIGEFYTAINAGLPSNKICFHGNNKTKKELEYAIKNNVGLIVIDAFTEADDIDDICQNLGKKQNVLIRINPGVEAHTHHYIQTANIDSKFGFSISNGQAKEIVKHVLKKKNINLKGLHCHIGSQIFDENSFKLAVNKMTDFYKFVKDELNYEFDTLNLGGGFGIWYAEGDSKKSVNDYASFIKIACESLLFDIENKKIKKPFLLFEPGRSIVGEAGVTLYTVGRIKEIPNMKKYLAVDGGMFDNPRFALYQAKYTVLSAEKLNEKPCEKYTIAGKCCESGDIIAEDCLLPKTNEGDIIAVLSTGAYNYSMASNYNRNFIPPVVFVKEGKSRYVVKPQTLEDLIRNDV